MSKYYFKIVPPVLVSQRISPKETSSALFIFVRKLFHKLDLIRYCVIQKESKQFVGNLSLEIIGTYCFSRRHYNVCSNVSRTRCMFLRALSLRYLFVEPL